MSALTGGFDAVLQIGGPSFAAAAVAMHQAESIGHRHARLLDGVRHEFSLGAPLVELEPASATDPRVRLTCRTRVLCRAQPVDDAFAPASSAVADLTLRGRLDLPAGNPAPVGPLATLRIDWSETRLADVVVSASPASAADAIQAALLDMVVSDLSATFGIGHLAAAGVNQMTVTSLPASPTPALGVALNFSGTGGTRTGISNLLQQDWVVALDAELVAEQIVGALHDALGTLPPPYGPGPALVSDEPAGWVETPLGRIQTGRRIYLDSLTVDLTAAGIRFSGGVRQVFDPVTAFPIPPVTATWSTTAAVSVSPAGTLGVSVTRPAVQLNEWYGVLFDTLTDGALADAVRSGVEQAIGAGVADGGMAGLFGLIVGQFGSVGRTVDAKLLPRAVVAECRSDALLIHGVMDRRLPAPTPVAKFGVLATPDPGMIQFNGHASWAPANDVVTYEWNFGDGVTTSLTGPNASFAVSHRYAAGAYAAALRVVDSHGRSASTTVTIEPRRLVLDHVIDNSGGTSAWQACVPPTDQLDVTFQVSSCGTLLSGISVTVTGSGSAVRAKTDATGRVTMQIDPAMATPSPPTARSTFARGSFSVAVGRKGFVGDSRVLELVDCEEVWQIVQETKEEFARRLDRLAGYTALNDLIASGFGRRSGLPPLTPKDPPPDAPVRVGLTGDELDAISVALGVRVMEDLVRLIELNRPGFAVHELLGLDPSTPEFEKAMGERFGGMWNGLDRVAERMEHRGKDDRRVTGPGPPR